MNSTWPSARGVIRRLKTSALSTSTSPGLRPRAPMSTRSNEVWRSVIRIVAGPVIASDSQVSNSAAPSNRAPATTNVLSTSRMSLSFRRSHSEPSPSRAHSRQLDPEGRTLSRGASECNPASVRLHDRLREREPKPRPGDSARRRVSPEELREDAVVLLLRDADALVAHADAHDGVVAFTGDLDHAAVGRVLDRIGEQVAEDLREPARIAEDGQRFGRQAQLELVLRVLRPDRQSTRLNSSH